MRSGRSPGLSPAWPVQHKDSSLFRSAGVASPRSMPQSIFKRAGEQSSVAGQAQPTTYPDASPQQAASSPRSTQQPQSFDPGYDWEPTVSGLERNADSGAALSGSASTGSTARGSEVLTDTEVIQHAFTDQLAGCLEWREVLLLLQQQSQTMTANCAALALARIAQLARDAREPSTPVGSAEVQSLLARLEASASQLGHKEIARALWALGTMRQPSRKLLGSLCRAAQPLLPRFNSQDLSTSVWALGTLGHNPGPLMQGIALHAAAGVADFQPKGLSMLLWGLAQLRVKPQGPLLAAAAARVQQDMELFGAQALANTMQALSRLDHYSGSLCSAVDQLLATRLPEFPPRELSSLLWVFVHFNHAPSAAFWQTLTAHLLESFKPSELCNIAWSMALLGECQQPLFRFVVESIVKVHISRPLDASSLRQVFQATVIASTMGAAVSLPPQVELSARNSWRSAAAGAPISLSHARVVNRLRSLGLQPQVQVNLGDGLPIVDAMLEQDNGGKLAIQVIGPHDHMRNTGALTGRMTSAQTLMQTLGYSVLVLRIAALPRGPDSLPAQLEFLSALLARHGVTHPVSTDQAAASMPQDFTQQRSSAERPGSEGQATSKGGLRRTRKSLDLPSMSKSSQPDGSDVSDGSWNEW
ncbi:hypothetical protein WJX73_004734 [Symbiochloris irregularis]|uniref:RAP domain-containing protein n=1 Tax=Symbiochloris irregularis TaxID=706552 RepID=A0AAW1NY32_9CHLO